MTDIDIRRVWVTRAEPEAARTAGRLADLGFEPLVAPVLAIRMLPVPVVPDHAAVAFTSMNGVAAFSAQTRRRDQIVYAVGDGTARAARSAGWDRVSSAGGDLNALARLILSDPPSGTLLLPGARERAGDLPALLAGKVRAVTLPVYMAGHTGVAPPAGFEAVLVHSPRAAAVLAALPDGTLAGRVAVAISAAAAAPLRPLGLADLRIADEPSEAALLAALGKPGRPV